MRAVDTNLLVRLVARDDPRQVALAEDFVAGGAWISLLVLMESVWVLERAYARTRPQLCAFVERLLAHASLVVESPDLVADALAEYRTARRAGFSDCLIRAAARAAGHTPVGTFDKGLARLRDAALLTDENEGIATSPEGPGRTRG